MTSAKLALTGKQHQQLFRHLFPGDGMEAAAVMVCGRGTGHRTERLLVSEVRTAAHERSARTDRTLSWPFGECFSPERIAELDREGKSFVTIHSHPSGFPQFSARDDRTDEELFSSAANWFDDGRPLGSAIMVPDGRIRARTVNERGEFTLMESVSVVGPDIRIWPSTQIRAGRAAEKTTEQTFGRRTVRLLRGLRVGVVGCSGTGSVMIELLARNSVGELVLVDPDIVENRNLNRIVGATSADAAGQRAKVSALDRAARRAGLGTVVETYRSDTFDEEVVRALADCDVLFGCVDSFAGRYHLDCLASAYLIPYFDVGVTIDADGEGGVEAADAVAHYIHPDGASLLSRGAYTMEQVRAEVLRRCDPEAYRQQRLAGYLAEVGEDRPAVLSVNMQAACMAFHDFLARIHGIRFDDNRDFGTQRFRLVHGSYEHEVDAGGPHSLLKPWVATGDRSILVRNNMERTADPEMAEALENAP